MYIAIIYQKDSKTGDLHEIEHRRFYNRRDAESWARDYLNNHVIVGGQLCHYQIIRQRYDCIKN